MKTNDSSVSTNAFSSTQDTTVVKVQFRIDSPLYRRQSEACRRLISAAYTLAVDGQPLSAFKTIVTCLRANGVKLIQGDDGGKNQAKDFITYLADAVRSKICTILQNAGSFGILCDGPVARKTGKEKELVFVRAVGPDGKSKYYAASLQDMDSYGSANANNLKESLDDTFLKELGLEEQLYKDKVVSITADGASLTAGHVNGLFGQMAEDGRPWLLGIHCILHRVELAITDILLQQEMFLTVRNLMIALYTLMKQSGSLQNCFYETARELDVPVYRFPKVHGPGYVGRQGKGLNVLLHNWVVLLVTISKSVDSSCLSNIKAKLTDIQMQLTNFHTLAAACLFKSILDVVAHLSLKFDENKIQPFDVLPSVEQAISELEDLQSCADSPVEMSMRMTLVDKVLSFEQMKSGRLLSSLCCRSSNALYVLSHHFSLPLQLFNLFFAICLILYILALLCFLCFDVFLSSVAPSPKSFLLLSSVSWFISSLLLARCRFHSLMTLSFSCYGLL